MMRTVRLMLQLVGGLTVVGLLAVWGLLAFAGRWMYVDEKPVKSDYILPLAGNDNRWVKAAELYRQGYAPTLLLSRAYVSPPNRVTQLQWDMGFPNYDKRKYVSLLLSELGEPNAPLESFGHGHISTVEEAEALRDHLNGRAVDLLIVTSPCHARRAKMIFEHVLPNCRVTMVSTDEDRFSFDWWDDQQSAQRFVMEFAKTVHYLVGGAFRSTDKAFLPRNQTAVSSVE